MTTCQKAEAGIEAARMIRKLQSRLWELEEAARLLFNATDKYAKNEEKEIARAQYFDLRAARIDDNTRNDTL